MKQLYLKSITILAMLLNGTIFISAAAHAQEDNRKKPYEIISEKRVKFSKKTAKMSDAEKQYLYDLFYITDLAFRERMIMLDFFRKKQDSTYIDRYNASIDEFLQGFRIIEAPNRELGMLEMHLVNALEDQKLFFNEWHNAKGTKKYDDLLESFAGNVHVQNNHKRLVKAFNILKENYSRENKENLQAFRDHIRALDLI